MAVPLSDGDEVFEGRLFRRIPNRKNRFDLATRRPLLGAFEARPIDEGELSAHLEALASEQAVLNVMQADPRLKLFGLSAIDVEAVRAELGARSKVIYRPDPEDAQLGHAHCVITNLDDEELQAVLLRHAHVLVEPQQIW